MNYEKAVDGMRDKDRTVWKYYNELLDYCNEYEQSNEAREIQRLINFYLAVYRPLEHSMMTQPYHIWYKTIENAYEFSFNYCIIRNDYNDDTTFLYCYEFGKLIRDRIFMAAIYTGNRELQEKAINYKREYYSHDQDARIIEITMDQISI